MRLLEERTIEVRPTEDRTFQMGLHVDRALQLCPTQPRAVQVSEGRAPPFQVAAWHVGICCGQLGGQPGHAGPGQIDTMEWPPTFAMISLSLMGPLIQIAPQLCLPILTDRLPIGVGMPPLAPAGCLVLPRVGAHCSSSPLRLA